MNSIIELIQTIKIRPAAYTGRNSISCLKAFLDGWFIRSPLNVIDSITMEKFQEWIELKYNVSSSHSWCDIILFHSQDESTALIKFFEEFDNWHKNYESTTKQ